MKIEILKQGVVETELDLGDGVYTIGRSSKNDIVLDHQDISRKHAVLIIKDSECRVDDKGSTNGIFSHGKKVNTVQLTSGDQADLGIYSLRCGTTPDSQVKKEKAEMKNGVLRVIVMHPMAASSIILCLIMVILSFLWTLFAVGRINALAFERERARAEFIAESATEMNRDAFNQTDASRFRIIPFEKAKGVVSIFLTDRHGSIVAPIDQINHALEHPALEQTINKGETTVVNEDCNRLLIFYPCVVNGAVTGVAVLTYEIQMPEEVVHDLWLVFMVAFLLLVAISFSITRIIVKIVQQPMEEMADEMERALKKRHAVSLDAATPYKGLERIKFVFEKLLVRLSETDSTGYTGKPPDLPKGEVKGSREGYKQLKEECVTPEQYDSLSGKDKDVENAVNHQEMPACTIDLSSHNILWWSDEFVDLFDVKGKPPRHFLEIVRDPSCLTALTSIISGDAQEAGFEKDGVSYMVVSRSVSEPEGGIKLIFRKEE